MGSLGLPEIAFIFVVALLIFGPKKLPELGRTIGRGMAEFRRAKDELTRSINSELALNETPVPPVLRARRLEDPEEIRHHEALHHEAIIVAPPPGEAPALTEARSAGFPAPAPEPPAPALLPEPLADHELANHEPAGHEPIAAPVPDAPGLH